MPNWIFTTLQEIDFGRSLYYLNRCSIDLGILICLIFLISRREKKISKRGPQYREYRKIHGRLTTAGWISPDEHPESSTVSYQQFLNYYVLYGCRVVRYCDNCFLTMFGDEPLNDGDSSRLRFVFFETERDLQLYRDYLRSTITV